jgi:hypothetical protein
MENMGWETVIVTGLVALLYQPPAQVREVLVPGSELASRSGNLLLLAHDNCFLEAGDQL